MAFANNAFRVCLHFFGRWRFPKPRGAPQKDTRVHNFCYCVTKTGTGLDFHHENSRRGPTRRLVGSNKESGARKNAGNAHTWAICQCWHPPVDARSTPKRRCDDKYAGQDAIFAIKRGSVLIVLKSHVTDTFGRPRPEMLRPNDPREQLVALTPPIGEPEDHRGGGKGEVNLPQRIQEIKNRGSNTPWANGPANFLETFVSRT